MSTLTLEPETTAETVARRSPTSSYEWRVQVARERLDPLLRTAAALDVGGDAAAWAQLRAAAHATTLLLTAAEVLPPHLRVRHGDPPAVIARTLTAAWRRAGQTS